jgi:hypothetical protein
MSSSNNINELLQHAAGDGTLSQASFSALSATDIGEQILAALGSPADQFPGGDVVLVTLLIDDSSSINAAGNTKLVSDGHNMVLDSLEKTQQSDNILIHTRYLNGFVLYPYRPVPQALKMNGTNYNPAQGTPLYDQSVVVLGSVVAKAQEFADNGIPVRTVTLIITDGADVHSVRAKAKTVASIVKDMLKSENHIIAAMGVEDGDGTDFRKVFRSMGIEDRWILTPGNTEKEIRRAFHLFSRSVVQASRCAASFSQTSLGGFGS